MITMVYEECTDDMFGSQDTTNKFRIRYLEVNKQQAGKSFVFELCI